ncbi:MAG: nucleoside deaminase [Desulfobacteraceae bacterium]|nr:nucleoside deaminase [Desulfobacteraceae bacterium]
MEMALGQAKIAFIKGEFPVGCVIVQGEEVVATGARQGTIFGKAFISEIDHAEIRALKSLENFDREFNPAESVLFCTMEPCLMCFAAIILAGIKKIVYAYEDPMGGGTKCSLASMTPLYRDAKVEVVPGVLREKSLDLFYDFFNKEGNFYWKDSFLEEYTLEQKLLSVKNDCPHGSK